MANNNDGFFANLTFKEIANYSADEFEAETYFKTYAIGYTTALFTVYCVSALLAWVLPGRLSLWSLSPIVALAIAEFVSAHWMKKRVPRPNKMRSWTGIILMLVPTIALFAGLATKLSIDSDFDNGLVIGAFTGIAAVLILGPIFLKWQNGRDQQRLNSQLED
ncbi:hypothetical protein COM45_05440 [Corynebacterium accolens]|uniref:Uncharacterized protein n=1 Tax=Corynebacterium accolens TaxID=38284 RepID=A0A2A4AJY9_9CORY|nr:hypothetical protein COM45_05440 [Corynebacterium accolens]